jgi:hypothetical protein
LGNPDENLGQDKGEPRRAFKSETTNFLGHVKADNYDSIFEELLSANMNTPTEEYFNENSI